MSDHKDKNRNPNSDPPAREPEAPAAESPTSGPVGGAPLDAAFAPPVAPSIPVGGYVAADLMPTGFLGTALSEANVADDAREIAPAFGDVLRSIGLAVAESQKALDDTLVKTAEELSKTTIKVVTDVVQVLDEDGRPDPSASEIITQELSLVNFVPPTPHMWNRVAVSMDMSVGEITTERGITFKQKQTSMQAGAGWSSFFGWFAGGSASHHGTEVTSNASTESKWASGTVRMDAELGSRPSDKLPVGAEIAIGPRITFSQGAIKEKKEKDYVRRSLELTVEVRKDNGEPNPGKTIEVDLAPFAFSYVTDATFTGNKTNSDGLVKVVISRDVPVHNALTPARGVARVRLGEIRRQYDVTL